MTRAGGNQPDLENTFERSEEKKTAQSGKPNKMPGKETWE